MQRIDRRAFNTGLFFGLGSCRSRPPSRHPDLVVTAVSWSPIMPKAGEAVTFSATITNQGTAPTPDGIVHGVAFRVDGATIAWSDTHTTSIPPGGSVTLAANGGPNGTGTWPAVAGTHTVRAHVDDANRIPELDETNNSLDATLTVAEEPGQPDLVVTALRWSHDDGASWHTGPIRAGGDVWFEADVRNQGTGPTPAGVIVGAAFVVDGTYVAWSDTHTQAVPAGAAVSLRANGGPDGDRYWNNVQAGAYTVRAHVDDVNRFPDELDKTNNTLDVVVTVEPATVGGAPDATWAGVNTNTGFYTSAGYRAAAEREALALNCGIVRMGMDGVGGATQGAAFTWATRDAVVDSHLAAGLKTHAVIAPGVHTSLGSNGTEARNNWRYFCASVFARYHGRIEYYILGNEPDLGGQGSALDQVDFAQIAMQERDLHSPGTLLESNPTTSPEASFLQTMINGGITRYVDVVGVHNYGAQTNDGRLNRPWQWMKTANANHGHPMKPVASSESGTFTGYPRPSSWTEREYQARWFAQNRVQLKRYGYLNVLYYSFSSTTSSGWDIATIGTSSPWSVNRRQPTCDTIAKANTRLGLRNAGFEAPNDIDRDWLVYWVLDQTSPQPVEWSRAAFLSDGANARTGSGYLRLTCGATTHVRQVVENLVPGRVYTLAAYARLSASGPTATLRALGFNHLDGEQHASASTTTSGGWQRLQVTFTPTKTWVVVSLEASGGTSSRFVYWDDVSLD